MKISHRIPFPDLDEIQYLLSNPQAKTMLNDCKLKNINRVVSALQNLTNMVPKFNDGENIAVFNLSRNTMQNASQKVRLETLHLLIALSKTNVCMDTVPYIMLLTHDDYNQLKTEASSYFSKLLKDVGGLRQCLPQLIPAIGSMGHIAFSYVTSTNADELISYSRLASCVVLAGTQLLSLLFNEITLNRKSAAELIQYIKVAINETRNSFDNIDSPKCLFFNQKLRCCLYRLQQETRKIRGCPRFIFNDFLKEKDPQCIKYILPLIKECDDLSWDRLSENSLLLNEFADEYLANASIKNISRVFNLLNEENILKFIKILEEKNSEDLIDFKYISTLPQIWSKLSNSSLINAISSCTNVDAQYLLRYSSTILSNNIPIKLEIISKESSNEDVADFFCLIGKANEIPKFIKSFPNSVIFAIQKWNNSPKFDWYNPLFGNSDDLIQKYLHNNPEILTNIVPDDKKEEFNSKVDNFIIQELKEENVISPELWRLTTMPDEMANLIIDKNIEIVTDEQTKDKLYKKIFNSITENENDSNAGAIIGRINSYSNTYEVSENSSYEFMENFFCQSELFDAEPQVQINFVDMFLHKKDTNFEVEALTNSFSLKSIDKTDKTVNIISNFISKLNQNNFKDLAIKALESDKLWATLFFILTSKSPLEIPNNDTLAPFLINNAKYDSWFNNLQSNDSFINYLIQCKNNKSDDSFISSIDSNNKNFLFVTSLETTFPQDTIYDFCMQKLRNYNDDNPLTSLEFYLILKSLLNVGFNSEKYSEMIDLIFTCAHSLSSFCKSIIELLEQFFAYCLQSDEVSALLEIFSNISILIDQNLGCCLKNSLSELLDKIDFKQWPDLRNSFGDGPISNLYIIDEEVAKRFDNFLSIKDTDNFLYLLENFPASASKWFIQIKNSDLKIRDRVIKQFSSHYLPKFINESFSKIQSINRSDSKNGQAEQTDEWETILSNNQITCTIYVDDEPFHIYIKFYEAYPVEPIRIDVPYIGKDNLVRECQDEINNELIRPNGLICAVKAWRTRILTFINNENPCPICLSLLDSHGELPTDRCKTCHRCCHDSCMKQWMSNSAKKVCPWCRSLWKQPRNRSKKQNSNMSKPS